MNPPPKPMPLGFVMGDLSGIELAPEEREQLLHPAMGGVILFTRNYASPLQLARLTDEIHALRSPPLLITVDQEGGRVQRFREGFTPLPAMRELGSIFDSQPEPARNLARQVGFVLAAELRACGVDLSFAPVLDLDYGASHVIGDRAFHSDPAVVIDLARQLIAGLKQGGMGSVGKHFPGHGYVRADSHLEAPVDERNMAEIEQWDLAPFAALIQEGLSAIMPAHVIYPQVDRAPAGFSPVWLQDVLRGRLGFDGTIFSDDLTMEGAAVAGSVAERARTALHAGCDMLLVCNHPEQTATLLNQLEWQIPVLALTRLARLHGNPQSASAAKLKENRGYQLAVTQIRRFGERLAFRLDQPEPRGRA
jgi:beta-N-acetylhexosaminidase